MRCEWCEESEVLEGENSVYWELPDGTRAIEITDTPCKRCPNCNMEYQSEETVKEIEDQLFLIDCSKIGRTISFQKLMSMERLLKRNYFDFS